MDSPEKNKRKILPEKKMPNKKKTKLVKIELNRFEKEIEIIQKKEKDKSKKKESNKESNSLIKDEASLVIENDNKELKDSIDLEGEKDKGKYVQKKRKKRIIKKKKSKKKRILFTHLRNFLIQ